LLREAKCAKSKGCAGTAASRSFQSARYGTTGCCDV
jgi:hypothetical protein